MFLTVVIVGSVHICVTLQLVDAVDEFLRDLRASVEYVSDLNLEHSLYLNA
jgi:hypothetical protein